VPANLSPARSHCCLPLPCPALHPLLSSSCSITTELLGAVSAILNSDEDMLEMFVTEKQRRGGALPPAEAHGELELLLENYHREIATLTQEASYLRKAIQSGQDMLNVQLDTFRNRMVRLNAQMAMGTVGISIGVSVFSVLGMNLRSGLEAHPTIFWTVTGARLLLPLRLMAGPVCCVRVRPDTRARSCCYACTHAGAGYALGLAICVLLHRWSMRRPFRMTPSAHWSNHWDVQRVRALMQRLGDIQDAVLLSIDHTTRLTRDDFKALLERASKQAVRTTPGKRTLTP
jgi:hypothetical protein